MSTIFSNHYPAISVSFMTGKGKVEKIELKHRPEGFFYEIKGDGSCEEAIHAWLKEYLNKKNPKTILPFDLKSCPPFTRSVYMTLIKIPFGNTMSYKEVAESLNNPKASRAVGNACGSNLWPLIVPCHRILAVGSALGGFSCGLDIKRELLSFEGISV